MRSDPAGEMTVDGNRFDQLVVALSTANTRRGIVRLLGALPFAGGLPLLLRENEVSAAGRRKRHKEPHKHRKHTGNQAGKHKKQGHKNKPQHAGCKAESPAETCAGTCGNVKNHCNKTVDCGSCACNPPCPVCQICDEETRSCAPDSNQNGDTCGEAGQVCQGNGGCACGASSCPACRTCQENGRCSAPCDGTGCCDGTSCQPGSSVDACGMGGDACAVCGGGESCDGGTCSCTPNDPCTAGVCGGVQNNCGDDVDCGECGGTTPICRQHLCTACSDTNSCPGGCCAADGSCQDGTSDAACGSDGQACDVCTGQATCQSRHCVCDPSCAGKVCGPDGCGGQCDPGCGANASCSDDGTDCVCTFLSCNSVCCPQAAICHASRGDCCDPDTMAQTCNGQCGAVIDNCGIRVDCGPCTCDGSCPACQVCDAQTGECIADPKQQGLTCGDGQTCQEDGSCACSGGSCGDCRTCEGDGSCAGCTGCCDGGVCVPNCGDCQTCQGGRCVGCPNCCDSNGACQPGTTDAACGSSGACVDCGAGRRCLNGQCVCDGTSCPDGCCDAQGQCQANTDIICGIGGVACVACDSCSQFCDPDTCREGGVTCDCSRVNGCSGHGCCTTDCICACEAPWTGVDCSQLPPVDCTTFATCEECQDHAGDGCVFCGQTFGGESDVCVSANDCLSPTVSCP
jgi:hypothetical protein